MDRELHDLIGQPLQLICHLYRDYGARMLDAGDQRMFSLPAVRAWRLCRRFAHRLGQTVEVLSGMFGSLSRMFASLCSRLAFVSCCAQTRSSGRSVEWNVWLPFLSLFRFFPTGSSYHTVLAAWPTCARCCARVLTIALLIPGIQAFTSWWRASPCAQSSTWLASGSTLCRCVVCADVLGMHGQGALIVSLPVHVEERRGTH